MLDLSKHEIEDSGFDLIPNGYYPAFVDKVIMKQSSAGPNYVNINWKIFGNDYNNRVVFQMLNINNSNEVAKRIALDSLKKLLTASGMKDEQMNFANEEELLTALSSCRCDIYVKTSKAQNGYPAKNDVGNFQPLTEGVGTDSNPISPDDIPF